MSRVIDSISPNAGFSHVDEKGRVPIAKAIRETFGLHAGSTVAWVKVGSGLLIIPQDEHLAQLMDAAAAVFERTGKSVDAFLADLDETREEVVAEHYGANYAERLCGNAAVQEIDHRDL